MIYVTYIYAIRELCGRVLATEGNSPRSIHR